MVEAVAGNQDSPVRLQKNSEKYPPKLLCKVMCRRRLTNEDTTVQSQEELGDAIIAELREEIKTVEALGPRSSLEVRDLGRVETYCNEHF